MSSIPVNIASSARAVDYTDRLPISRHEFLRFAEKTCAMLGEDAYLDTNVNGFRGDDAVLVVVCTRVRCSIGWNRCGMYLAPWVGYSMFGQMRFDDTISTNKWFRELGALEHRKPATICEVLSGILVM